MNKLAVSLAGLQCFIGIGAVPSGVMMLMDSSGKNMSLSLEMLTNTPFNNFFVPALLLLFVNGIGSILGGLATFKSYKYFPEIAMALGSFLMIWILAQVYWMGLFWLHILYILCSFTEFGLAIALRQTIRRGIQ
ncbi:hypothetical protein HQ531_05945 [bacterium]|nr:hypothetical protein [bacterium]